MDVKQVKIELFLYASASASAMCPHCPLLTLLTIFVHMVAFGMSGFTKLFSSIVASSVWCEDDKTRLVWITMLAMSNRDGVVEASMPGLANAARVSVEDCRNAILKFESPDLDSRSTAHEGRRALKIEGGWKLLNYETYRRKLSAEERREYKAAKQAEYRAAKPKRRTRTIQHGASPSENRYVDAIENGATNEELDNIADNG